jgi:hypothetical protein
MELNQGDPSGAPCLMERFGTEAVGTAKRDSEKLQFENKMPVNEQSVQSVTVTACIASFKPSSLE